MAFFLVSDAWGTNPAEKLLSVYGMGRVGTLNIYYAYHFHALDGHLLDKYAKVYNKSLYNLYIMPICYKYLMVLAL